LQSTQLCSDIPTAGHTTVCRYFYFTEHNYVEMPLLQDAQLCCDTFTAGYTTVLK